MKEEGRRCRGGGEGGEGGIGGGGDVVLELNAFGRTAAARIL